MPTYSKTLIACGFVDDTQDHALYSVVAIGNMHPNRPGHLPLSGLDPKKVYTLTLESINQTELAPFNKVIPTWCETPVTTTGELLMKIGVPLPVMPPQSALLIGCHREVVQ